MSSSFRKSGVFSALCILSVLAACSPKKADNQATSSPGKPLAASDSAAATPPAPDSVATAAVSTDSAGVSPVFLKGLREMAGSAGYKLRGNQLLLDQQEPVEFPTDLPAGKPVTYSGRQGAQTVTLTLTRLNYTSIRFAAEIVGGKNGEVREEGVADLNPGFYLAAEVPEDTESQTAYGATEYLSETPTRNFSILVGLGPDVNKAELGVYDATGKPVAGWQGVPTLRRLAL
ncbi:hypothetical protein [Hymenobacter lucidus]|uniref:Lipoprotein n=1 Tax=Hymenobacter lucidus TaxID=2880930 RepID=A0ABS8AR97_9BACT|nr:hypothetical protein [Hymenobacter lucidus]MCB2408750.1 hypothetical protein [Hymenobacter lucidus]